ncbi:MAG: tetratricopeptide repeat protein [Planctomycetes bacterium]|nr:tetratricopeptide repeat protein [Planctomycetota bacterium]
MKARVSTFLALLFLAAVTGCAGQRSIDQISDSGHKLYKRGDYSAAAAEFQEITDRYPGDWRAQYMLGVTRLELGQINEARRALEIAWTRRPGDADVADALAAAMLRGGDEETLFRFLRDRAEQTHSVNDYVRLARFTMEMNDPDTARRAVDTAIELDSGMTVEPYLVAADLAERVGDLEHAVFRLRQAYAVDPTDREVTNALHRLGEVPGPTIAMPSGASAGN